MTLSEFIEKYKGKFVEAGGTSDALNQCVDLANQYLEEVLGLPKILWTNAVDFPSKAGDKYEYILNTLSGIPDRGDLVIFRGTAGHISIFIEGDTNRFTSFDENFPTGSPCHIQEHNYDTPQVLGWLHPKVQTDPLAECLRQHTELVEKLNEEDTTIKNLNTNISDLGGQVSSKDKELLILKNENKMLMEQAEKLPIMAETIDELNKKNIGQAEEIVSLNRSISQLNRRYEEMKNNAPKLFLQWLVSKIETWRKK